MKRCFLAWEIPESLWPSVPLRSREPSGIHTQKADVALSLWNSGSGKHCCSFLKPSSILSTPREEVDRIYTGSSDRSAYRRGTQELRIRTTDLLALIQMRTSAKCPTLPVATGAGPTWVCAHVSTLSHSGVLPINWATYRRHRTQPKGPPCRYFYIWCFGIFAGVLKGEQFYLFI